MSEDPFALGKTPMDYIAGARTAWGYFIALSLMIAISFAWLAGNWEIARPVIEHPVGMFFGAFALMGAGGGLIYLVLVSLVIRPLRKELDEARADIDSLRASANEEERKLRDLVTDQAAEIGKLKATVELLAKRVDELSKPAPRRRTKKSE